VAISGVTVVIGAPEDDDAGNSSGSAYVYVRNGGVWTQQQKLTASDAVFNDRFGNSVGISGDTIVVGAWLDDSMSGSAYVFIRSGGVWTQQQKIRALDAGAGDLFGSSVSISGDRIVVGAPGNDDVGIDSGSAYIFVRSAGVWAQAAKLTAGDASSKDNFGTAVAIDGTTAVVSAIEAAPPTIPGAAYVFVLDQGGWIQ
jgi:hypothetical protein